jgi:hypothetical protein
MGGEALSHIGFTDDEIIEAEKDYRSRDRARLEAQIASGDLHALREIYFRSKG